MSEGGLDSTLTLQSPAITNLRPRSSPGAAFHLPDPRHYLRPHRGGKAGRSTAVKGGSPTAPRSGLLAANCPASTPTRPERPDAPQAARWRAERGHGGYPPP